MISIILLNISEHLKIINNRYSVVYQNWFKIIDIDAHYKMVCILELKIDYNY